MEAHGIGSAFCICFRDTFPLNPSVVKPSRALKNAGEVRLQCQKQPQRSARHD
jgi:hypothetical protein